MVLRMPLILTFLETSISSGGRSDSCAVLCDRITSTPQFLCHAFQPAGNVNSFAKSSNPACYLCFPRDPHAAEDNGTFMNSNVKTEGMWQFLPRVQVERFK